MVYGRRNIPHWYVRMNVRCRCGWCLYVFLFLFVDGINRMIYLVLSLVHIRTVCGMVSTVLYLLTHDFVCDGPSCHILYIR